MVLLGSVGCGFTNALAHPEATQSSAALTAAAAPAASTPDPDEPRVIVDGDLLTSSGAPAGRLGVTVGPVRTGLVPPVHDATACHFDGPSLQYVPVVFTFGAPGPTGYGGPGLAAHVAVSTGPATPSDIGDVGIFVESGGGQKYCAGYPPLPTTDKFWNQMGKATITAWIVLDRAVTPETPGGRPEVFPTLELRISDMRRFAGNGSAQTFTVGPLTVGDACADDPDALCVSLG